MFIRLNERVLFERLSVCAYASFPFSLGGGVWDSIVLITDHCLSIYFRGLSLYGINLGIMQTD